MDANAPTSPELRQAETQEKAKELFLAALRGSDEKPPASISLAASRAGVSRATVYRWRDEDDDFAAAWTDAYESGTDRLEDEQTRRGYEGVQKPVFYKGQVVGHVQEFSDTNIAMQLNARRPEKYRTNHKVEHSGGVKIVIAPDDEAL